MVQNCGRQIFSCYADTSCRTALNCLNSCHFNDQVWGWGMPPLLRIVLSCLHRPDYRTP